MNKIVITVLAITTSLMANNIELTGKYSGLNGNPFKKVLNTPKIGKISIYSRDDQITLPIESNLDQDNLITALTHKNRIVLLNKSIENVMKDYFIEDYYVEKNKSPECMEVNVISGKTILTYFDGKDPMSHLSKIEVMLEVELINNKTGKKNIQKITMDQNLGATGSNYNWSLSTNDKPSFETLDETVGKIIETELYSIMKGL